MLSVLTAPIALAAMLGVGAPTPAPKNTAPPMLHVQGKLLKTAKGKVVRLQGVNVPSLEWMPEGDGKIMTSIDTAIDVWKSNAIRLPLCQDRWYGKGERQTDEGAGYRQKVADIVKAAAAKGAYVILDLHWSDAGEWGKYLSQHKMPDQNSVTFWKDVATLYKNNPAVLFDLYNEPRDVSWDVWKNGGMVDEDVKEKQARYETPGMQKLLDTIRETGARNIAVIGGLDWAYDLTGVLEGYAIADPKGNGVMYASHIYPWKTQWDEKVGAVAARHPVLLGEVGCEPDPKQEDPMTWAPKILAWMDKTQVNWTAWCFHPSASPRLLADWDYKPTPYWGEFVFAKLTERR